MDAYELAYQDNDFAAADAEVEREAEWLRKWTCTYEGEPVARRQPWETTPLPVRRIVARQLLRERRRFGGQR